MAGAAGDALGYTVEFMSRKSILAQYGNKGITKFDLSSEGKALVSDNTQMTLFTACGMLMGVTRGYMRGIGGLPEKFWVMFGSNRKLNRSCSSLHSLFNLQFGFALLWRDSA